MAAVEKPRVGPRAESATIRSSTKYSKVPKKAPHGGGHKFLWKDKTNDGTTYLDAVDPGDPVYSSGNEEDVVLVSGSGTANGTKFQSKPVLGPKYTLAEFKRRLSAVLDELFTSSEVDEAILAISELECSEFAFEIVKKGVSKALDRRAHERELCSKLFSASVPKLMTTRDVTKGFERLFESLDDLVLDAPLAPSIVGDFLVRCVVDEALPPAVLCDRVFAALGGAVVGRARRILSREHAGAKLERIWGPADGRDAAELKLVIDQILGEFLVANDVSEAVKCVRELEAPNFGHEVVKRAVKVALAKPKSIRDNISNLIKALAHDDKTSPCLTPIQAQLGFKRLTDDLPDLTLDVPNAKAILDDFELKAKEDGVLL
ncbi:hypothetical protein CTAYLR_007424 [Chrysophaeum taylorii]|uniref:MI domain-containing protein n=1 Tax=Chrysophaeum taylorii TaxID=2483200 RepID=A0AAD7U4I6_9STRA|nr:hypothetical protein CTAYLR_007424 [Chrysophaeum taylorii]